MFQPSNIKPNEPFIKAGLIDCFIGMFLAYPLFVTFSKVIGIGRHEIPNIRPEFDQITLFVSMIYFHLLLSLVLLRDATRTSFRKRHLNIIIIHITNGKTASLINKIIRNLPIVFFSPLELIFKLITPNAPFGDMIADTELIKN